MLKRHASIAWVFVYFLALVLGPIVHIQAEASPLPWIDSPVLALDNIRDLGDSELPPYSINGNRDCYQRKVITRPALKPPVVPALLPEQSHVSCVVDTGFGSLSSSGDLQRVGTSVAGEIRTPSGSLLNFIPIPRSTTAMRMGSTSVNGVNLFFIKDFGNVLTTTSLIDGTVAHTAPPEYTAALKDRAGNLLYIQPDSIAFSADGHWMVGDAPFIGSVRVNLETFEVLPFGDAFNYSSGSTPSIQAAVSSDGRYAVVASRSFTRFKIYDLSTCSTVPAFITGPVTCRWRDLSPLARQQLPTFGAPSTIRFAGDTALHLYADYTNAENKTVVGQFVLKIPGTSVPAFDYLALGDSFASGEGAFDYKAATDTPQNKCHLSQRSYPFLLGGALHLSTYDSVACSGAKIDDVLSNDKQYTGQVKDGKTLEQRDIQEIIASGLPGFIRQLGFVINKQPNVVTISMGGNDVGFDDKVKRCLEPDTCFATYEDRLEIVREINNQFYRLTDVYQQIKNLGDPRAKIYVISYPKVAKSGGNCGLNVYLDSQETDFSELLVNYINTVVKQAAAYSGVGYVSVEDALVGHRLCEASSSEIAVNGLTAGNDIVDFLAIHGPVGNESFHPNAYAHTLMEQQIMAQTGNFTLGMPLPNPSLGPPAEDDSLPILAAPRSGRQVNRANYDSDLTNDVVYRGTLWQATIDAGQFALKAAFPFTAILNSQPANLGTFNSDSSGNLSFQFTIPADMPAGYHTLHLYGQNIANEPIDIYKTVYVAASATDLDGDGTPNGTDSCPTTTSTSIDVDKDGIDDACDGFIGAAPPPPPPTPELPPPPSPSPAPDPPVTVPPAPADPPAENPLTPPSPPIANAASPATDPPLAANPQGPQQGNIQQQPETTAIAANTAQSGGTASTTPVETNSKLGPTLTNVPAQTSTPPQGNLLAGGNTVAVADVLGDTVGQDTNNIPAKNSDRASNNIPAVSSALKQPSYWLFIAASLLLLTLGIGLFYRSKRRA